jgi:hypothetical protein
MTNTTLDIKIESFKWSDKRNIEYSLYIDGKLVLRSSIFMDIDKEIRKYERLRFKENVK